jgi:hypothetical protein
VTETLHDLDDIVGIPRVDGRREQMRKP